MDDLIIMVMGIILVLASFMFGMLAATGGDSGVNQDTLNSVCQNITGNETAIAKTWNDYPFGEKPISRGQLICEIPKIEDKSNIKIIGQK